MITFDLTFALLGFALVTQASPGPNNIMLLASGMNYGWYRSLPHMLGIGLGFPFMIIMVGLGIAQVFEIIPYSYTVLKIISVIYLLYLAYKIAMAKPLETNNAEDIKSKPMSFLQAAMFQWVNPKAWAMALTVIAAYSPEGNPVVGVFFIAVIFVCTGSLTVNAWTLLGGQLRTLLRNHTAYRYFNYSCAFVLVLSLYPILMRGA